MVAGGVFGAALIRQIFSFVPLRILGIISYSLYLWHLLILRIVVRYEIYPDPEQRWEFLLLRMVPFVIIVSVASYLLVEKPFLVRSRSPGSRGNEGRLPPKVKPPAAEPSPVSL